MAALVWVVLASWVLLTIVLVWRRPGPDAVLISMIGGWAVLPTGSYPASVFALPVGSGGSMHALAVPTALWMNKALAIALGCLVGVIVFDWATVRRLRPIWLDTPLAGWCVLPVASTLANGLPLAVGLAQTRYLVLAWGVPYMLGRIYFGGNEPLRRLGLALVLAGLVCVPLGLLEFVPGPFLYDLVYGSHPYRYEGAARLVGHRPLVFLEHGNQFGVWVSVAAVAAVWLSFSGRMPTLARVPGRWVAAALVTACLVFQSHEAMVLTLAVLAPFLLLSRSSRFRPRWATARIAAVVLALAVAGVVAVVVAEQGDWSRLRSKVRGVFVGVGKTSFTWRLARSEENLRRVAQRPILGWARADWSAAEDAAFVNPVNLGLWLLALGMFGAVGLICSAAILLLPVIEVIRKLPVSAWISPSSSALAMTAFLLLIVVFDSLFNSILLLPLLAGAGGLNSWSMAMDRRR